MPTEKDEQNPNTSVPQDGVIESEVGGRARTSDPATGGAQDETPNTSVPQDNK
jgi:hypothetical protein